MCFYDFFWLKITIVALALQLIWYYSTSWVRNIGDLVLLFIFLFRIIECGWFFILGIIVSNFLKIEKGWAIFVKYATIVVYVGPYFFRQFLENSRSHRNAYNNLISSKNTHQLNGKGIDDSTEYMFDVTDGHQNYQKRGCSDLGIKKNGKWKVKLKISKPSNLWLKIGIFTIFSCSFTTSHPDSFRVNEIMIEILMTLGGESDWFTLKHLHL